MKRGKDEEQPLLVRLNEEICKDNRKGDTEVTFVLILSVFIAVCGSFTNGCATGFSAPVQSGILSDLGLSIAEYSLFGSMLTIGGMLGSLVSGKATDLIGCRGIMGLSDILCIVGWLFIALAKDTLLLNLGRLALGIANGIFSYAVPVYIAEITPRNLRGGLGLLHQLMISCGIALVFILGLLINWRVLALIGTLPCLIQLSGLFLIPESPRWLVKRNYQKEYEGALQRLRGEKMDISKEATDIKANAEAVKSNSEDNFFSVFRMKYAYALTVSLGLMGLAALGGAYGILFYTTAIFESAGFSGSIGTVSAALIQLPPIALGVFLMDSFGRRPLLLYSAAGTGAGCLSVALSFLMKEHGWMIDYSPYLALTGILTFAASYSVGMGGIPYVIMSEIFPTNIKAAAGSLATVVCYLSSWIVSYAFNFMMDWSTSGTFFIFTGVNVFTMLFIAKLVPETKGRTLEEIQESITHVLC